jgi:hypothetical protein
MESYVKPMILPNEEVAEGVFAASGSCYTASGYIAQFPQDGGAGRYVCQLNGTHSSEHTNDAQTVTVTFNQPVTYLSSAGTYISGSGTNTIQLGYTYHQNPNDQIGLGNLEIESEAGLTNPTVTISDGF